MIINDLPKSNLNEDILHFTEISKGITNYLINYTEKESLTISVDGEWGSGKTTMSNFIIEEIKKNNNIEVMRFSPWMITELSKLLDYFFNELMKILININTEAKKDDIKNDLKKFFSMITPERVSFDAQIVKVSYDTSNLFNFDESLYKLKENISSYIKNSEKKILIVVDDIDRLTNKELETFFRLIKGIADFDNLIYLLLFDKQIVSKSLNFCTNGNGEKYLDKIIQYSIFIPKISDKTLKAELIKELETIYKINESNIKWLHFLNCYRKYINNLRDIKRLSNALKIEYFLLKDKINFYDFLIITIIKITNIKLYTFIKNNPQFFLLNHSIENYNDYTKRLIDFFDEGENKDYKELLSIIFPKNNSSHIPYDSKNKYIASYTYFDNYFSLINDSKIINSKDLLNAIENITKRGIHNFIQSISYFLNKNLALDFLDILYESLNNNSNFFPEKDFFEIIKNLIYTLSWSKTNSYYYDLFYFEEKIKNIIRISFSHIPEKMVLELIQNTNNNNNSTYFKFTYLSYYFEYINKDNLHKDTLEKIDEINKIIDKELTSYSCTTFDKDTIRIDQYENLLDIIKESEKRDIKPKKLITQLSDYILKNETCFLNIITSFIYYDITSDDLISTLIDLEALTNISNINKIKSYVKTNFINKEKLTEKQKKVLELIEKSDIII